MSLSRQSASAAVAAVVASASRLLLVTSLARRLTAEKFGQFAYAQWVIEISILIFSFGAPAAVSRYAAEFGSQAGLVSAFLRRWVRWAVCASVAAALGSVVGAWVSGMHLELRSYLCLFVWTATQGLWTMQTAALTGCQRFNAITLANILFAAAVLSGLSVLPIANEQPAVLFGLMAVGAAAATCVGVGTVVRRAVEPAKAIHQSQWGSIRIYAINMWLTTLLTSLVWSRGEYPFVRVALGEEGLARYAAPMTLFAGGVQVVTLGTAGVAPYLTDLWGRHRRDSAIALARWLMNLQLLVCCLVAMALTLLEGELLGLAFGAEYRDSDHILAVLSIGLVALAVSAPNHLLQLATDGRCTRNFIVAGVLLLFLLALVLTPTIGLPGAALARSTTMLTVALGTEILAGWHLGARLVSTRNLAVAMVSVLGTIAFGFWRPDFDLIPRTLLLAGMVLLLVLSLRDDNGHLIIQSVARDTDIIEHDGLVERGKIADAAVRF